MTLLEILKKLSSRWWIILVSFVFFTIAFYPQVTGVSYRGSGEYGINLMQESGINFQEDDEDEENEVDDEDEELAILNENANIFLIDGVLVSPSEADDLGMSLNLRDRALYFATLDRFSLFLRSRMSSAKVQSDAATAANISVTDFSESNPFYIVSSPGLGYIEIIHTSQSKDEVEKVFESLNQDFDRIVSEWNMARQEEVKIFGIRRQDPIVIEQRSSIQSRLLPSISGLIFGLALILLWPLSEKEK